MKETVRKSQIYRWEDNIKVDLKEIDLRVWTGIIWLRLGTSVRALVNMVT
jgi:hypothetical protein